MKSNECSNMRRIITAVLNAIFPLRCLACNNFFRLNYPDEQPQASMQAYFEYGTLQGPAALFQRLLSLYLCTVCLEAVTLVEPPFCLTCGLVFRSNASDNHTCADCIVRPRHFQTARAALIYDRSALHLIHCFKYKGKIQLAEPLGGLLLVTFLRYWNVDDIDIVIPVPLHAGRFKQRGFNQAFLLIQRWKHIAGRLNRNVMDIALDRDTLVRNRSTATQTGLSRNERLLNIKNAFSVRQADRIAGKHILLVDDVYTTGATVDECARVLIQSGAQSVDVLTVARAV